MNYLSTNGMIGKQHPKLCSYWSQQRSSPISIVILTSYSGWKALLKLIEESFDFYHDNDLPNMMDKQLQLFIFRNYQSLHFTHLQEIWRKGICKQHSKYHWRNFMRSLIHFAMLNQRQMFMMLIICYRTINFSKINLSS